MSGIEMKTSGTHKYTLVKVSSTHYIEKATGDKVWAKNSDQL